MHFNLWKKCPEPLLQAGQCMGPQGHKTKEAKLLSSRNSTPEEHTGGMHHLILGFGSNSLELCPFSVLTPTNSIVFNNEQIICLLLICSSIRYPPILVKETFQWRSSKFWTTGLVQQSKCWTTGLVSAPTRPSCWSKSNDFQSLDLVILQVTFSFSGLVETETLRGPLWHSPSLPVPFSKRPLAGTLHQQAWRLMSQ